MEPIRSCLHQQAEALGDRRVAQHGAAQLSFGDLAVAASKAAAELDAQDYPRRMPVYVDTTDGNWCSYLISFFGAIAGGRIPILAPYGTSPMGPYGRLVVGTRAGMSLTVHRGEIRTLPDYAHHFANPLDIVLSSGSTGQPRGYLFDEAHFVAGTELRSPRHELRALHFGIPFPTSTAAHALVIRHFLAGMTSIHLDTPTSKSGLLAAIDEFRPVEVSSTPYALSPLFDAQTVDTLHRDLPRQLRVYAGPLSDGLATRVQNILPRTRIVSIYGTTEGGNTTLRRTGIGSQFNITEEDPDVGLWHAGERRWARLGEPAEIVLAASTDIGPPLLIGERNDGSTYPPGWIGTGDLGRREADGRLTFLGRSSDIVLLDGERQSALKLEHNLEAQGFPPAIVFDMRLGANDQLCLLVEAGDEIDGDKGAALASAAGCGSAVLIAQFPRTPLGKIRRREMIAEVVAKLCGSARSTEVSGTKVFDLRGPVSSASSQD